jgi:uroporphyrinogen III methyltransferase/synthase
MTPKPDRPLAGRRILLTRPSDRGAGLARRLERLGAIVERRPTIALVPPADRQPAREAVEDLDAYEWILFTSPSGVAFFFDLLREVGRAMSAAKIAAIGPATARALEARGASWSCIAEDARQEGLARLLIGRIRPGRRVLLVRPERAREALPQALREAGLRVDAVAFYRNVADPSAARTAERIREGVYDGIVFTSPSTLERLLEAAGENASALRRALGGVRRVAIGEVTAAALRGLALEPDAVAAEPTEAGIVEAVRTAMGPDD